MKVKVRKIHKKITKDHYQWYMDHESKDIQAMINTLKWAAKNKDTFKERYKDYLKPDRL